MHRPVNISFAILTPSPILIRLRTLLSSPLSADDFCAKRAVVIQHSSVIRRCLFKTYSFSNTVQREVQNPGTVCL